MQLQLTGNLDSIMKGLREITDHLRIELDDSGFPIKVLQQPGQLRLSWKNGTGEIVFDKPIHFFRGLGLWLEHYQAGQDFEIMETPQFHMSGVMLDASRNAVPTVEEVKKLVRNMAVMGLDTLMLYTEDTYEVKEHPYFGYMRGRYTTDELRACDDYAYSFGIEMIPCIQALGHLREALKWNYAAPIRDTDDILLVGDRETYAFLEDCIKAASEPFRSRRIHIGMDETFQLGLGKYLAQNGYEHHVDLMNRHLREVLAITESYNLKPMIWSDMYLPIFAENSRYKDEDGKIREDILKEIPDVELVYWNYYNKEKEKYVQNFQNHRLLGSKTIFAGGAWTWNGIAPNYGKAIVTTEAGLAASKQEGVQEVFVTMWGDNGAETPFETSLPILQLFAEHTYHKHVSLEQVAERFAFCSDGQFEDFMLFKRLDETPGVMKDNMNTSMTSKVLLYQDVLIGLYDENIKGLSLNEHYQRLAEEIKEAKQRNAKWYHLFDFYEQLARVLSKKAEIGIQVKQAYDQEDKAGMKVLLEKLSWIRTETDLLRKKHRTLWLSANKPFGWEIIDIRYGGVIIRIGSVIDRISDWVDGHVPGLAELEETRLMHDGPWEIVEGLIGGNVYHRIVTAGNFSL